MADCLRECLATEIEEWGRVWETAKRDHEIWVQDYRRFDDQDKQEALAKERANNSATQKRDSTERDSKMTATTEGVWGFYEGTEEVFAKPECEYYPIPKTKKKRQSADAQTGAVGAGGVPLDTNTLETKIIHYKLDLEEWKENDKKV